MPSRVVCSVNGSVTVVIPARNAAATLGQQLVALDRQVGDVQFEVVLVDNGSTDGTAAVAHAHGTVRYSLRVVSEAQPGINWARNAGVAAAGNGLVLLCDADDEAAPGWVAAMVAAAEPGTWVAGVVDYAALNSTRTRLQWGAPALSECSVNEPFVDRTFGCCCGFDRAMWADLGGFDNRLSGIGGDETEFFMRAYAAGYRQRWVPNAVVGYRLRPGVRNLCRQRFRQGRNQVRMSRLPGGEVGPALPGRRATRRALAKLAVASPKYVVPGASRYRWLAAVSRHLGRLAGYRERS